MTLVTTQTFNERSIVHVPARPGLPPNFAWDATNNIIRCDGTFIRLSRTEGRIFDLLLLRRGTSVSVHELNEAMQLGADNDDSTDAHRVRLVVMRLRNKTNACPSMRNCIVTAHGSCYILI